MADFIAVIRRAVDGLSDNTPEMRQKVYERAKSAVVRQLENMKPRPPEAMFQRQIDKLEAAIREVESEHADALPAEEVHEEVAPEAFVEAAPAAASEVSEPAPAYVEEPAPVVAREPEPQPAPVVQRELVPESAFQPVGQARRANFTAPPVVEEPVSQPVVEASPEPIQVPEAFQAVEPEPDVPAYQTVQESEEEPVARLAPEVHPAQLDVTPYATFPEIGSGDQVVADIAEPPKSFVEPAETVYQPFDDLPELPAAPAVVAKAEPAPAVVAQEAAVDVLPAAEVQPETVAPAEPVAPMPKVSYDETDVVEGFNDFLKQELNRQVVPPPPSKAKKQEDFSWDAPFDDLPELPKPEAFEKALEAKQKQIASGVDKRKSEPQKVEPVSARAELEDLLGLDPAQRKSASPTVEDGDLRPEAGRVSKLDGKSFKTQKTRRAAGGLRLLPALLGMVGVVVVGAAAYGGWLYKSEISQLVSSLTSSGDTGKAADSSKRDLGSNTTSAAKNDAGEVKKPTEVASLNSDVGQQKFTQRLMPDGTEAVTETASVPIDKALPEGKTVAGQTEKGKEVASATAADAKPDATANGQPQNDAQPLGATQKMFLYEERLGQTSPVAVPGTVVWKEKAETDDGKPDPEIEAQIDVPGRKISALLTFKRNTDPSLPASHIIEIVFDLPKDFEEGNVDSIQRVAFKQTEQDRGNPLIAVPAKITDDFHMVALNDDADARKVNLELMKTRSWIDIPITYRNGRRALITIEKGATGTAVFDKVMSEWDALGTQSTNNQ